MSEKDYSYDFFNLFRFIAAVLIAMFQHFHDHFLPAMGMSPNLFEFNRLLWMFSTESYVLTEMFFIISGMLFVLVYIPRIKNGYYTFDKFIYYRAIRIYPLVIITTICMWAIEVMLRVTKQELFSGCATTDVVAMALDILFAGKPVFNTTSTLNGPIWYINVLMICYVIAYGIAKKHIETGNKLFFYFLLL